MTQDGLTQKDGKLILAQARLARYVRRCLTNDASWSELYSVAGPVQAPFPLAGTLVVQAVLHGLRHPARPQQQHPEAVGPTRCGNSSRRQWAPPRRRTHCQWDLRRRRSDSSR